MSRTCCVAQRRKRRAHHFLATDAPERFARVGEIFLGQPIDPAASNSSIFSSPRARDRAHPAARPGRSRCGRCAFSARSISRRDHLPSPTSFSVPTIERTWLCRNERANGVDMDFLAHARDVEAIERLHRRFRLALRGAEGGEVVLPDQRLRRVMHRLGVEIAHDMPDVAASSAGGARRVRMR